MAGQGYYGGTYDRYVSTNSELSTISKMKETYWTTKQAVMTKLGKKQDEHIVASDAELDAKLELFHSVEQSCLELLRVIEKYQDRLCILSREENAMGRLLKASSENDKTRAGKMMAAVSKAQNYSSQQLLQLRAPLVRLYQEVEVFRHRAVSDTLLTVERMEAARTEYRGALLWMKDVSEMLDPDTSKQLQKFRMVQAQVKRTKAKFDRLKLDTMQKIDLLAASRCNMFSQVLVKYQSTLLNFWEKMSYRMTAVADTFKGYQYYEFNMLKELGEPSKKLAEETGASDRHDGTLDESLDDTHQPTGILPRVPAIPKAPGTLLPCFESTDNRLSESSPQSASVQDPKTAGSQPSNSQLTSPPDMSSLQHIDAPSASGQLIDTAPDLIDTRSDPYDLVDITSASVDTTQSSNQLTDTTSSLMDMMPSSSQLIGASSILSDTIPDSYQQLFDTESNQILAQQHKLQQQTEGGNGSLNNLLDAKRPAEGGPGGSTSFIDFGDDDEDVDIEEIRRKQDEEFDFSAMLKQSMQDKKQNKSTSHGPLDLLSSDLNACDFDMDKDDMTLLNEILNTPAASAGGGEFSSEWQAAFGPMGPPLSAAGAVTASDTDSKMADYFMPSSLLDLTPGGNSGQQVTQQQPAIPLIPPPKQTAQASRQPAAAAASQNVPKPKKKDQKAEMSAWFNLFAELDPLSNPDAIGRTKDDLTDA